MSASGRFVALRRGTEIEVVDIQGTAPRRRFELSSAGQFAIAGTTLALLDGGRLRTVPLESGHAEATAAVDGDGIDAFRGRTASAVVVDRPAVIVAIDLARARLEVSAPARADVRWLPLHGRAVLAVDRDRLAIITGNRSVPIAVTLEGRVHAAAPLFGGKAIVVLAGDAATVLHPATGAIIHRVRLGDVRWHAIAPDRGLLLVGTGDDVVTTIDLRLGRVHGQGRAPHAIAEAAIDDDGRGIVLAGSGDEVTVMRLDALGPVEVVAPELTEPAVTLVEPPAGWLAPSDEPVIAVPDPELSMPDVLPLSLGAPRRTIRTAEPVTAKPFIEASEHLAALLDLVAARAAVAIAEAWDSGRISADADGDHPFELEVGALAGLGGGRAPSQVAQACRLLTERAGALGGRVHASLDTGMVLPFVELADELGFSAVAMQILVTVIAPRVRGEIARMYRILGNGATSSACDVSLVTMLLGRQGSASREQILDELSSQAPLVRFGVIHCDSHGGLEVDDVLVGRLRGQAPMKTPARTIRGADRTLDALVLDRRALRAFMLELATARPDHAPLRAVIRGRRGSGRHTVLAALAARIGRPIACIDASELPLAELGRELTRAALSRAVPVVSNAEIYETGDRDASRLLHQILRDHPGPLVLRIGLDSAAPLDPGFVELVLPVLSETRRGAVFSEALVGISADGAQLARRYKIGPGTIHRVVDAARARIIRADASPAEHDAIVDDAARQHLATRIGANAQHVTRLATWDQVSLPDDMLDSLRELIGRARHGRTVFDDWGYDDRIATARGITALFYGPPGTGKTMVAGLIARELGLELYRVDLAKVMSKWIGETEKHLGELFDAAEDGRIMLLFDEADSLFAKRSEVKSSNDRYANLEVNYLLQRLDAFEGVAVLTTNLDGSIDPAFKRRLSMRMYFPLPDEEQRAHLWSAHVPPRVPTSGVLDFAALARRFPLSGGYIRNSALRGAFLAAQEGTALTQQHLERAVLLEYRELGKLADDGRVD